MEKKVLIFNTKKCFRILKKEKPSVGFPKIAFKYKKAKPYQFPEKASHNFKNQVFCLQKKKKKL